MGLTRALGRFEAGWFLRFLGLEELPRVRDDGRLHAYTAGLSRDAVTRLCEVAARAAAGVETLAGRWYGEAGRIRFFLALSSLGLGDVAGGETGPALRGGVGAGGTAGSSPFLSPGYAPHRRRFISAKRLPASESASSCSGAMSSSSSSKPDPFGAS